MWPGETAPDIRVGADRAEVWLDGRAIGDVAGASRYTVLHDTAPGEALLAIRAWAGTTAVGYRSRRVLIPPR